MSESRYWMEALRLIDDKTRVQRHNSRVPMALHNAKIHRPSVYISAKVKYEKMLEFEKFTGHIPRSNLPSIRRNKRREASSFHSGAAVKMSKPKNTPHSESFAGSLNGMALRSLVCSRCKLSAAQSTASKETATKTATRYAAKADKQRSDRKERSTSKPGKNTASDAGQKQAQVPPELKAVPGVSLPSSRQAWRVSEKTNSNVNRLISLLHALDDLPRDKSRAKRQTVGYKRSEPKRRMKLSKPGRMIGARELFLLQAGDLSLRNILIKEDKVLSGLLQVSSKRPTPLHIPTGRLTSSASSEQSERVPNSKSDQYKSSVRSSGKNPKQSPSRHNSNICHKDEAPDGGIAQFKDHKNQQGKIGVPALEHPFSEGEEAFRQGSLPPLYISHHSTICLPQKQNPTKQAGTAGTLPRKARKNKCQYHQTFTCSRDHRKRNGESVETKPRSSAVSKVGLPPIVIPRVTTPLRGFTPWTDVTPSPCMLSSTTEDCTEIVE